MSGESFKARDTVDGETPANRAMSLIVTISKLYFHK
jgi:hypothetical protein